MNEGKSAVATSRARPHDVRADYEELRILVDRLRAIIDHRDREFERLIHQNRPLDPEIALIWRVGHDLTEQCLDELNALRQRIGLRIDLVVASMEFHEARRPPMI